MSEPRCDTRLRRHVPGRREPVQADGEHRDEDDPDDERRHHRDDRDEAGDRAVEQTAGAQRRRRTQDEAHDDADDESEGRDRQADTEAETDERRDVRAVDPAGAELAVQDAAEPVPVLHEERLVEPPLALDLRDGLGCRLLTQLDPRRAESAHPPQGEGDERRHREHRHEDGDRPPEGGQDAARGVPRPGQEDPGAGGRFPLGRPRRRTRRGLGARPCGDRERHDAAPIFTPVQLMWPGFLGRFETALFLAMRFGDE